MKYSLSISNFLEKISQFNSVQSFSFVQLFVTPWTAALQASLSITSSWSLPKLISIESVRSLVFPSLFFSSISLHGSLRKAFLPLCATLWNSAFRWVYLSFSPLTFASLLFTAICKASSDNHFAFLHFFFLGMVLIPASYTMSQTSVHSSSGTVSIRSNPLNLFFTSTV